MAEYFKMTLSETELVINMIELISILQEKKERFFSLRDFESFYNSLREEEKNIIPKKEDLAKVVTSMTRPKLIHALDEIERGKYQILIPEKKQQYDLYFQSSKKMNDYKLLCEIVRKYQTYLRALDYTFDKNYQIKPMDTSKEAEEILNKKELNTYFDLHVKEEDMNLFEKINPNEEEKIIHIEKYLDKRLELEKQREQLLYNKKRQVKNLDDFFAILFYYFYKQGITTIDKEEFMAYFTARNTSLLTLTLSVLFERGIMGPDAKKTLSTYFDSIGSKQGKLQAMDEHNRKYYISISHDYENLKKYSEELDEHDKMVLSDITYRYQNHIPMLEELKEQMIRL